MKTVNLRTICTCFAIITFIFGIFGLLDLKNRTSTGYRLGDAHNIIEIFEGTGAEKAGLQVGDKIISIGGIAIEDTKSQKAAPRTVVGETKMFVVERGGSEISLPLTYDALRPISKRHWYLSFASGVITCGIGLWLLYQFSSIQAILAGLFLLFFGSSSFPIPPMSNNTVESIYELFMGIISFLALAILIDLLLHYPQVKEFRNRSFSKWLIYFPAFLMPIFHAWINFAKPTLINTLEKVLGTGIILFYIGWIFLLLIQSFRKHTVAERSSFGLNWIYIGLVVGFMPILVLIFIYLLFPEMPAPTFMSDILPITFTAIPVFLFFAIKKWEQKNIAYAVL